MKILGILNITDDSFSDGGKYLAPEAALAHGLTLMEEGADILDIGAASSNPDAKIVSPETEIARLQSVLPALHKRGQASGRLSLVRQFRLVQQPRPVL